MTFHHPDAKKQKNCLADATQNNETEIAASGSTGSLRGTLLLPAAKDAPIVLIVPGSGPTDRNGNAPYGLHASTYHLLAHGLAQCGIATVRIDKRGMYGSASALDNADDVIIHDYSNDLHAWVRAIGENYPTRSVWLLGHSEGGLVSLVAAQSTLDIHGIVLVATPGRPLRDVLRAQLMANPENAPVMKNALSVLDWLAAGEFVDASKIDPVLMPLFRPAIQRFLISEFALDPAELLTNITKPVLIVQGLRDIQVGREDAERLKQANPKAELAYLVNANHVLKAVGTDDRSENIATYSNPELPLADCVVETIANFMLRPVDTSS
ncbi:alpha/beta hydrolase [Robbsia andropogonis]|uniref:alpha/beta hydrolase n=1 Tax=Robbsia andropogonis TaxID=28092 RepID=UPI0004669276|nr:alpha/beta fold hydrolase [Robbsia andropogonis]MCP1120398.1 lysophospholipase [Robbsia andropogonis]MCP1130248.1 lysophospholipase [Robbsia andropogonis]